MNTHGKNICFADDTALVYRGLDRNEIIRKINEDLARIAAGFDKDELHPNTADRNNMYILVTESPQSKNSVDQL